MVDSLTAGPVQDKTKNAGDIISQVDRDAQRLDVIPQRPKKTYYQMVWTSTFSPQ